MKIVQLLTITLGFIFLLPSCSTGQVQDGQVPETASTEVTKVIKTDADWKEELTEEEYYILREKGTERSFTGKYWDHKADGVYTCAACKHPLFDSKTKFKSGTGWPSYYQPYNDLSLYGITDKSHGWTRTEVLCSRCDGHLGHVFNDGPKPTGLRYCINSASLDFVDRDKVDEVSKENK